MTRVIVQSIADYTHAQLITAPGRALVADEPPGDGGDDLGPTPYELLTAALGACTAMTLQMYARRKGYALEEVAVEVEHSRVHAEDCADCPDQPPGPPGTTVNVLHRRIVLRGTLNDAQRADLLRVAAKCPVHRTLTSNPQIVDSIEVV